MTTKAIPTVSILLTPRIELDEEDKRAHEIYTARGIVRPPPKRTLRRVVHVRMTSTANRIEWEARGAFVLEDDGKKWKPDPRNWIAPGRSGGRGGTDVLPEGAGKIAWAEVRAIPTSEAMLDLLDKDAEPWTQAMAEFREAHAKYVWEQQTRLTEYNAWVGKVQLSDTEGIN